MCYGFSVLGSNCETKPWNWVRFCESGYLLAKALGRNAVNELAKRPQQLVDILFLGFHAGVQLLDIPIDPGVVRPVPFNGFFDTAHPLAPIVIPVRFIGHKFGGTVNTIIVESALYTCVSASKEHAWKAACLHLLRIDAGV
jgi:hypothetical protein